MIDKITNAAVSKSSAPNFTGGSGNGLRKFMKNPVLGKVLDSAADNPVICQSAFSLALCCVARPATNFAITKDKQDATYASCHSISSGAIGFVWPFIFATPLAKGVSKVLSAPHKYLKPEVVKKFYPNVGIADVIDKNGKKIGQKIKTNIKDQMLRKDGTVLCQDLEPMMVYGNEQKAAFEKANAGFYVDKSGVVRSKTVAKTEGGKVKLDKDGGFIGCAVQRDMTPITEEMEIGVKKEQNVKNILNMIPDIILAPPRAALTIALIPPVLKNVFGVQKASKTANASSGQNLDITSKGFEAARGTKSIFDTFKKGGMQ